MDAPIYLGVEGNVTQEDIDSVREYNSFAEIMVREGLMFIIPEGFEPHTYGWCDTVHCSHCED